MPAERESSYFSFLQAIDLSSMSLYAQRAVLMALGFQVGGDVCEWQHNDDCTPNMNRLYALGGIATGFFVSKGIESIKYTRGVNSYVTKNNELAEKCTRNMQSLLNTLNHSADSLLAINLQAYLDYCLNPQQSPRPTLSALSKANARLSSFNDNIQLFVNDAKKAQETSEEMLESVNVSLMKLFTSNNNDIEKALGDDSFLEKLISGETQEATSTLSQ